VWTYAHFLLTSNKTVTVRQIYYLFKDHFLNPNVGECSPKAAYRRCNIAICDAASLLGLPRAFLGIYASPKGKIYADILTFVNRILHVASDNITALPQDGIVDLLRLLITETLSTGAPLLCPRTASQLLENGFTKKTITLFPMPDASWLLKRKGSTIVFQKIVSLKTFPASSLQGKEHRT
jgi:hypothetical protein